MAYVATCIALLATPILAQYPEGSLYSPPISSGYGNWSAAYAKAHAFVCNLTITEKVNLTTQTGTGASYGYSLGIIPRVGFRGLALDDSPTGVRSTDYSSAFTAPLNMAMTWDRDLIYAQAYANGAEHKAKGVNIAYSPVVGPLGRSPESGRIWEGYSPDPYLSGVSFGLTVAGMNAAGTIAVGKHFVLYEQEHFRQVREWNDWHLPNATFNTTEPYSSNADDRTLHELYLWPWYDAVHDGMASVMCSYNQLNNTQACQNNHLLNDILKGEMGFQGFIVSDDGSQHSGVLSALAGMDMTILGETSPNGELGLGISFWGPNLTQSVLNGSVPEWRLDDMATRIMAAYYYLDQDQDFPELNFAQGDLSTFGYLYPRAMAGYQQINEHVDVQDHHADIIRRVGANSIIMLKNVNNTLPLNKPKQIAIIGEDAGPSIYGPNGCPDRGCDNGTLAMGWGSGSTNFPYLIDPLAAIQTRAIQDRSVVQYVLDNYDTALIDSVVAQATVCLVFINCDSGEGYIEIDGNYGDRKNLTAWLRGDDLVNEVAGNCSNTVVIAHTPGPIIMEPWIEHPNVTAVLMAGLPGQESGNALVDVLYGAVNPSGKTPWTIGKRREDYGTDVMYVANAPVPQLDFTEGLFIDYRHFDQAGIKPRFEFGFGLSYTTFSYSNLRIQPANAASSTPASASTAAASAQTTINPSVCPHYALNASAYTFPSTISSLTDYIYPYLPRNSSFTVGPAYPSASVIAVAPGTPGGATELWDTMFAVTVTVANTGSVAGQEVAQLYLALGNGEPVRQLRGFNKTMIEAGASADVSFTVRQRDLSIWDVSSQSWVDVRTLGTAVGVSVGASSRDLRLNGTMAAMGGGGSAAGNYSASVTAATTSAVGPVVTEYNDGQPQVPTEYSDGQVQVPATATN
ncbi:beta-glucosidase [Friedmanniomyces endolithicus]|nr:beta-glucosidase [Friedmanniomyces endolithicus]